MTRKHVFEYNKQKFVEAIDQVRTAFAASQTRGRMFFISLLLPKNDDGINEANIQQLQASIEESRPDQGELVNQTIENMRYIRKCVLVNATTKKMLHEIAGEVNKEAAIAAGIADHLNMRAV